MNNDRQNVTIESGSV